MVRRNLKSIAQFAAEGPFSEHSLRWMISNSKQNGLNEARAIVRIGRRVFIDEDAFEKWVAQQQPTGAGV